MNEVMNWKKLGFTQRKPKESGVYFIATDGHLPLFPARRLVEHWDVAYIYFFAESYSNFNENCESSAVWRVKTLDGMEYTWRPGLWMRGPLSPLS